MALGCYGMWSSWLRSGAPRVALQGAQAGCAPPRVVALRSSEEFAEGSGGSGVLDGAAAAGENVLALLTG